MTGAPVEELAETMVELADTLVDEFDLDDFLRLLADRCVHLLDVSAAGLLLIEHGERAPATGTSDERAALLARFEADEEEGPSLDSCRGGTPVVVPDLAAAADRWPRFVEAALATGFAGLHTIPLRLRDEVIGALNLYREEPGELDVVDARVGRAMADIATVGLLQSRALRRSAHLAAQLQHALTSRVLIEQAKGIVGERLGLDMDGAFLAIRRYARSHNERLAELALSIVDGKFDTTALKLPE